jgi:phage terminase large subunit-like protein
MAGRGFGKTLAGANWIAAAVADAGTVAGNCPHLSIALVGATLDEARRVMVEGRSGLLAVAGGWIDDWSPSLRRLRFTTGAEAFLFSGASPEQLRGPEHHFAWCDELAKWEKPQQTWDMLQLGLRCGERPRVLVTTTPRPGPVLTRIMADPRTMVTGGPTSANPHLPDAFLDAAYGRYAGTRLGRQELDGILLPDVPGALWTVELLERCRLNPSPFRGERRLAEGERGEAAQGSGDAQHRWKGRGGEGDPPDPSTTWVRLVIGVDPPTGDGTCGIVVCARDAADRAHVLADHSVTACSPETWSRAVADAARIWGHLYTSVPVSVVAEQNQGGRMVKSVLHTADPNLRVKPVTATVGKNERAAPVAMLFEAGKVVLHGHFPELEAELLGMIAGGRYEGPGGSDKSPDRADAMVWALTELMVKPERPPVRVRAL